MPSKPRIGKYRHTPADEIRIGPGGALFHTRTRRRMPFGALVGFLYAIIGPILAAGTSALFHAMGLGRHLPTIIGNSKLPPSPTLENVLFGAGVAETALGSMLAGYWLWIMLWRTRLAIQQCERGVAGVLPHLLRRGASLGAVMAFASGAVGIFGLYLRTAPAAQPWFVRPFFGLLAIIPTGASATMTGVIPLVLLVLGSLCGAVSGAAVAFLWQHYPEEPIRP